MTEPGRTLRDAVARGLWESMHEGYSWERDAGPQMQITYRLRADAVLVALKEHLAEHPEAIAELGWDDVARRDGWLIDVSSGHMRENFVPVETVHGARVYAPPPNDGTAPAPPSPSLPGEDA